MRTFTCPCGNALFFENTLCLACGREVGWCPGCQQITALEGQPDGTLRCGNPSCGAALVKCQNYRVEQVCNRCVLAGPGTPDSPLCDCCRYNDTIPDLSVPGNREHWYRLERAKRRLIHSLDLLGLPHGGPGEDVDPPLSFDFKADPLPGERREWWMGEDERVFTGHDNGKITINLREADPVERERARVAFDESHRTVVGHFRHEIGHYYWQMWVQGRLEDAFARVFGDHRSPDYAEAQERHYRDGPPPNWRHSFISAYATMHPWEDFAETFATYLAIVSVLDTARHQGLAEGVDPNRAELGEMVERYQQIALTANELNRSMGIIDLAPDFFTEPILEKLRFVHELVRSARSGQSAALG